MKKYISAFAIIALFILSYGNVLPQEVSAGNVKSVFVSGNKSIASSVILSKIKTKVADPYTKATVDEDIKRIYGLGFFSDVKADVKEYEDGIEVIFVVVEKPTVSEIIFVGNKAVRAEKLKKEIKSKQDEILDERKLKEDIKIIRELYYKKGFTHANVDYAVRLDEKTGRAVVTITIDESKRVKIRKITFEGNHAFNANKLIKLMATKKDTLFTSGVFNEEAFEGDLDKIKAFYESSGFLDIKLEPELKYDATGKLLHINIKVDEGKKYLVGEIKFLGNAVMSEEVMGKPIKMTSGSAFSRDGLRQDVNTIQGLYFEKGYIYAVVKSDTFLNPSTGNIDVTYNIVENELTYVNRIEIKGNIKTKDKVIRRELRVRPDEPFDGKKLQRSKERLYNLGYFEEISFDTEKSTIPNKSDLVVEVKESKTGEFSFGGGFSTVDKAVGFIQVTQRNFDIMNFPTFTGGGQQLVLRAELGTVRRDYQLSFTEPWIFDYPYLFGFDLYQSTRLRATNIGYGYDEMRRGGALRFGKEFTDYDRADLTYRLEKVEISDVSTEATADLKKEEGSNNISSLTLALARDTTDSAYNPSKGYQLFGSIEDAGGPFGGDKDYLKGYGSAAFYIPPHENHVIELKLRAGLVDAYGNSNSVPIYERFYAGGANTIRGFRERRVGPRDPASNDPIGGEALLIGNAEYVFPVVEFLKGAVFFDAGNVWSKVSDFGSGGYKYGTGVGVRVKTPIGPVKLDYGFPLKVDAGEKKQGRFHFTLSKAF